MMKPANFESPYRMKSSHYTKVVFLCLSKGRMWLSNQRCRKLLLAVSQLMCHHIAAIWQKVTIIEIPKFQILMGIRGKKGSIYAGVKYTE